jgi:WD40 repeat protein
MAFMDDKLITGSDDGLLKSWSLAGWSLARTVPAHQHVVWALARYGQNVVISGSSDTIIKVWNVTRNDFTLVTTLTAHKDEVQALAVDQRSGWLLSGSDDGTVCIHDCKTWQCIRKLGWQGRAVLSLLTHGDMIVAGLGNGTVSIYLKSQIMLSDRPAVNLEQHKSCVMAIAVANEKLVTASYDRTIRIWVP